MIATAFVHLGFQPFVDFEVIDSGVGEPLVVWKSQEPQPTTEQVATAYRLACLASVSRQIKADRDRRKSTGTPVGAHVFHSDPDSRIQQIGLVMMGAALPAGIMWKTVGGAFVEMTPTLAGQIFQANAARDVALFAAAEAHIAAAAASDDPLAYDFTAGWPA